MQHRKMLFLTISSALFFSSYSQAAGSSWSLGGAVAYSPAVYKDTDYNTTVIPLIGYEGEHLFFRGFSAGYRLLPVGSERNVIFRLAYDPRTLKPEDSDNAKIRLLDERKASVLAGVSYQVNTKAGTLEASAGTDVGDQHNGLYAELAWRLPLHFRGWGVTPSIGYAYNSEKLNNHLYGVSKAEEQRSSIKAFDADWDGHYFIGASAYLHLTRKVRLTGSIRYLNLDGDLADSPILERGIATTGTLGVSYVF
ncbi:outer membrane protein [Vibrio sp. ES.051]|uniref:MipA/OmpV family protein n=1 Tax=Vibrio sp. ES.051 TaxID=1761909 RepID=UPI000BF2DD64|nr:MipA/OmpV family protein [Vibrio sp. ES.051]PFG45869.1 outer membrane protein [Vibrio sp. ES.051]